jgi:predicted nucleic acid-binding protein
MSTLVDTNLITRLANPKDRMYQLAVHAIYILKAQGEVLHIEPQNLYEFWVVSTRPLAQNGLGWTPGQAQAELARVRNLYTLLADDQRILPQWEQLVIQHQVSGKNAHDARLVAAMLVHGVTQLLTLNKADFQRFPSIVVVTPQEVLASAPPPP